MVTDAATSPTPECQPCCAPDQRGGPAGVLSAAVRRGLRAGRHGWAAARSLALHRGRHRQLPGRAVGQARRAQPGEHAQLGAGRRAAALGVPRARPDRAAGPGAVPGRRAGGLRRRAHGPARGPRPLLGAGHLHHPQPRAAGGHAQRGPDRAAHPRCAAALADPDRRPEAALHRRDSGGWRPGHGPDHQLRVGAGQCRGGHRHQRDPVPGRGRFRAPPPAPQGFRVGPVHRAQAGAGVPA